MIQKRKGTFTWFNECKICGIRRINQGSRKYLGVARFTKNVSSWFWIVHNTGVVQHAIAEGAGEAPDIRDG